MSLPTAPRLLPVLLFTALYMLAAIAGSAMQGNREFVFYIGVMLVLIAAMRVVHAKAQLSAPLLWALSIWGLLHMAGGLVPVPETWPFHGEHPVLYSLWLSPGLLKYDQVVHAYGFGVTTWLCWHALSRALLKLTGSFPPPTAGLLTLCAAAGMGFGALNEVIEFIAVLTIPNTNVGGYENTGWDLVANLVGCTIATLVIRMTQRAH